MTPSQRIIYSAEAHVAGGRAEGHGRTADVALTANGRRVETTFDAVAA